jgi:hypothetical protein
LRSLVSEAAKLAGHLEKASTSVWCKELAGVLKRVTLGSRQIQLQISKLGLIARLGTPANNLSVGNKDWIREIPYELRNRGQQLRIVPSESIQTSSGGYLHLKMTHV